MTFQGVDKTVPDKLAIDFFLKGLRPEVHRARRLPESDNFEVIPAYAEEQDIIQQQERAEDQGILESLNTLAISDKVERLEARINHPRAPPKKPLSRR